MYVANIILYSLFVVPYTALYVVRHKLTPVSVFLVMEISYFYGICFAPRGHTEIAIKLETIYVVAMFCYILGVEFERSIQVMRFRRLGFNGNLATNGTFTDSDLSKVQWRAIWAVIFVSIIACSYLFVSSGINVFVRSIQDFFSGNTTTYKTERASFFGIRGMGYIYQLRAILLPILTLFVCFCNRRRAPTYIRIPLVVAMIVFLLGTGQRNAFVFFCMVAVLHYSQMKRELGITIFTKAEVLVFSFAAVLFLVALTISNGRVSGNGSQVVGALESLVDRIAGVNQRTAITAFSYIDSQPTCWGYDWLMTLKDILPGKSGYLTVSRIVYFISYGTYNGTGDPCIWGSAWYNFHILGVTVFPVLLGIAHHHVYGTMLTQDNKGRLYMLIYAGISVYLGLWIYGTPMNLFNIGVVSLFILRWLIFTLCHESFLNNYSKKHRSDVNTAISAGIKRERSFSS